MVLDQYRVAKGLVGSLEVIFDESLNELPVEPLTVRSHVPHRNEFVVEGAIEAFIHQVVGWHLHVGEVALTSFKTICGSTSSPS